MTDIFFGDPDNPIAPSKAIIHDNDTFEVQWSARNGSAADVDTFIDRLVITSIPEGCPGSDDADHPVVYDSGTDGDPDDFTEPALAPGEAGPLLHPTVGPFTAGSYRLTVTLADDLGTGDATFNCVTIVAAP
ncbi:hypothetical protein AB0H71_32685 [Nocardia sp. NPDC050697]|uniref:hypothetical protein n=1 Tax=Nocardia sp. NPDC050697 TaxID=3155158 RepID=UPI0033C7BCAE